MLTSPIRLIYFVLLLLLLTGCQIGVEPSIISRSAEALLTKNNELQFKFRINEKVFTDEKMYKVRVTIHNEELAKALGKSEIVYGEDYVYKGEFMNVRGEKGDLIVMKPIPLINDLHTFELQKMITTEKAIKVEVFNEIEVIGQGYLSNFASQF